MIQNRLEKIKNTLNEDIILVAVSKTKPIEQIKSLYDIGHVDFGENKVQELVNKHGRKNLEEVFLKLSRRPNEHN